MKALRLIEPGQPLVEADMDPARVGPHDIELEVEAAGICRSDVHYRSGARPVPKLPVTLGHEVAGTVSMVGSHVTRLRPGDRVAIHYQISCGICPPCLKGLEQFCGAGWMIGLGRDGGYAEVITVPERNAYLLPDTVPTEVGAIMMCSTATSLHALRKARYAPGETVAVFGCGGLGVSAIKLALALGAKEVYGIDINPAKLALAGRLGALPVPFSKAGQVRADVALELVGMAETMRAAVDVLSVKGRAVAVGITDTPVSIDSFKDLALREAEVIGSVDHLGSEIEELIEMVDRGVIDLSDVVTATVPLAEKAVNEAMDRLEAFDGGVRTVITP